MPGYFKEGKRVRLRMIKKRKIVNITREEIEKAMLEYKGEITVIEPRKNDDRFNPAYPASQLWNME